MTLACLLALTYISDVLASQQAAHSCLPQALDAARAWVLGASGLGRPRGGAAGGQGQQGCGWDSSGRSQAKQGDGSVPMGAPWAGGQHGGFSEVVGQCWARQVYGLQLLIEDQTPNIGQMWYLFTELFTHYQPFFKCVLQCLYSSHFLT